MPDRSALSAPVMRFVEDHVQGFEDLEVLLLMTRSPGSSWTAVSLAEAAFIPPDTVLPVLERLTQRNMVEQSSDGTFRFLPTCEHAGAIAELRAAYDVNRVEVIALIAASAMERVRTGAIRTFAEAFRLRGPKKHG